LEESRGIDEARKRILEHEGNAYQLEHRPDLIIIPTIGNIEELISRLEKRGKKDDAIFENVAFQGKLKPLYESDWFRDIFEKAGSKVAYLDAGISVESSGNQAVEIYRNFLSTGNVLNGHDNPNFN
jgi:deoxyadenosine/deoxycytidine kinase